jgi:hypothetical protein
MCKALGLILIIAERKEKEREGREGGREGGRMKTQSTTLLWNIVLDFSCSTPATLNFFITIPK